MTGVQTCALPILTAGDYEKAMYYLELGMARDYYSVAYRRYRNNFLTANANILLSILFVIIIAWVVWRRIKKKKGIVLFKKKGKKGGSLNA